MTPTSLATNKGRAITPDAQPLRQPDTADARVVSLPETPQSSAHSSPGSLAAKRVYDFVVATVLLLLTAPLFLLIAAFIKINSRGPILFQQERVGKNGKVFQFYKFRTMEHDSDDTAHREFSRNFIRGSGHAGENGQRGGNGTGDASNTFHADDSETGSIYKMTADPRVTRVGRLLRRTSLDELPQLINVIRGDMSLVGPRPPVVYELEHYQEWHKRRLVAKPGITGLWQVSGRSSVPFDEMVQLDLYYIDHRSLRMDFWIMARTLPVMLKGDGAY